MPTLSFGDSNRSWELGAGITAAISLISMGVSQHIAFCLFDVVPHGSSDGGEDVLDRLHGCAILSDARCLWATDYFDRFMRNEQHFETTKHYIEMNPVNAGLCAAPADWRFSSAGWV